MSDGGRLKQLGELLQRRNSREGSGDDAGAEGIKARPAAGETVEVTENCVVRRLAVSCSVWLGDPPLFRAEASKKQDVAPDNDRYEKGDQQAEREAKERCH